MTPTEQGSFRPSWAGVENSPLVNCPGSLIRYNYTRTQETVCESQRALFVSPEFPVTVADSGESITNYVFNSDHKTLPWQWMVNPA